MVPGDEVPQYRPMTGELGDPPFRMVTESHLQVLWFSISKSTKVSCGRAIRDDHEHRIVFAKMHQKQSYLSLLKALIQIA